MNRDSLTVAAATLTAAILAKTELPPNTDAAREALRIYRQTLRKILNNDEAEAKKKAAATAP
jgi:hypothetical protein